MVRVGLVASTLISGGDAVERDQGGVDGDGQRRVEHVQEKHGRFHQQEERAQHGYYQIKVGDAVVPRVSDECHRELYAERGLFIRTIDSTLWEWNTVCSLQARRPSAGVSY